MQNQTQIQEFLNNIGHIQNTPSDKANEVLTNIRNFYEQTTDAQTLGFVLYKVADHILRLKAVNA